MASTAIGAAGEDARTITFMNKEHKEFYLEYLPKCRWKDVYHKALVYCLGIDRDTRKHVNRIYDFKNGSVKPECLQEGWQTSGSVRVVRMAFNLYCNGTPSVYDYIRLTCLIPELLKLLDEGKINFTVGVSLTYLSETEQIWVKDCIVSGASSVTGSMATKLKQYSGEGKLTELAVQLILNEKKTETGKVTLTEKKIRKYFPKEYNREV